LGTAEAAAGAVQHRGDGGRSAHRGWRRRCRSGENSAIIRRSDARIETHFVASGQHVRVRVGRAATQEYDRWRTARLQSPLK